LTAVKTNELTIPAGQQGAAMRIRITAHPTDVNFSNLQLRELPGPATGVFGFFTCFPASEIDHDVLDEDGDGQPDWSQVINDNTFSDIAAIAGFQPEPACPSWAPGGFDWQIPTRWHVIGVSGSERSIPGTVLQQTRMTDSAGTTSIFKLGAFVIRTP
jgi:hypothetical protein